jgi:hypothetical protein
MAAAIPHTYDDQADDVFDTGDPRSFLDDLVVAERAGMAAFEELVSPLNAMWCIGSALLGMAWRAPFRRTSRRGSR